MKSQTPQRGGIAGVHGKSWDPLRKLRQLISLGKCSEKSTTESAWGSRFGPELTELEPRVLYSATPLGEVVDLNELYATVEPDDVELGGDLSIDANDVDDPHLWNGDYFGDDSALVTAADFLDNPSLETTEIIFLDSSVSDFDFLHESLMNDAATNDRFEVVVLYNNIDGIDQITNVLAGRDNVKGIHVVSHGSDGVVQLGNSHLTAESLSVYAGQLASWGNALTLDADILFYGCNLAATEEGEFFVESVGELTGADVAASDDETGHVDLGGDWDFEFIVGQVETEVVFSEIVQANCQGIFAIVTVDNTTDLDNGTTSSIAALIANDGGDGISLREAITAANNTTNVGGPDEIHFGLSGNPLDVYEIIVPVLGLPGISDAVVIDAATQVAADGSIVVLNGANATISEGLSIQAGGSGSTIRGFSIVGTLGGIGIYQSDNNVIEGNFIGYDPTGTVTVTGTQSASGILVQDSDGNTIDGNTIVYAGNAGISMTSGADNNVIVNNFIGTDSIGTDRGNGTSGVALNGTSANNEIGRIGEGNTIAFNGGDGVYLSSTAGDGNSIRGNSIHSNDGIGIDLQGGLEDGFGVTTNDTFPTVDADSGPNELQNYPTITSVTSNGLTTTVNFNVNVNTADNSYVVDFYSAPVADSSGHGEAQTYLGSYHTGAISGSTNLSTVLDAPVTAGHLVTATTTLAPFGGGYLDTSEFALSLAAGADNRATTDLDADDSSGATAGDFDTSFAIGGGPINIADSDAVIVDLDSSPTLTRMDVKITNLLDVGSEIIDVDTTPYAGISDIYAPSTGVLVITGTGTVAEYEAILRSITYDNTAGTPDTTIRALSVEVTDGSGFGTISVSNIEFVVNNQAPVVDLNGVTAGNNFAANFNEGDGLLSIADAAATVTDVDNVDYQSLSITLSGFADGSAERVYIGGERFDNGASEVSTVVVGSTTFSLDFDGTGFTIDNDGGGNMPQADLQALLHTVSYHNISQDPIAGDRVLTIRAVDGDGLASLPVTSTITVAAVEDSPIARDDFSSLDFDGVDDYVSVSDSASLTMTDTMTMEAWFRAESLHAINSKIIINKEGEYEVGILPTGEIAWAFDNIDPDWDWHRTGYFVTLADWTHVAVTYDKGPAITYINTYINGELVDTYEGSGSIGDTYTGLNELRIGGRSNNPTEQFFDGQIDEVRVWNTALTEANIQAALDIQLVGNESGLAGYWNFDAQTGTVANDLTANGNDGLLVDGGAGTAGPQWTGYSVVANSSFNLAAAQGPIANDLDPDGDSISVVAVDASSTLGTAVINGVGGISYDPSGAFDNLTAGQIAYDTVSYTIEDANGNQDTATVRIEVIGVNDAPVLNNVEATALAYTENDGGFAVTQTLTLTDPDGTLQSATVVISSGYVVGQDSLTFVDQNGIAGIWNSVNGTMTLTGAASVADYQTALRSITYTNNSDYPDVSVRTIDFTVDDGTVSSATVSRSVNVESINDDPFNTGSLPATVTVTEDTQQPFDLSSFMLGDPDVDTDLLTVTLTSAASGQLSAASDFDVLVFGSGSSTLTLVGGLNDLNNFFSSAFRFQYRGASNLAGLAVDTISITASDGGSNGTGGGSAVSLGSVNVDITAVNDAPTVDLDTTTVGSDFTTSFSEDGGPVTIANVDAILNDVDSTVQTLTVTLTNPLDTIDESLAATVPASISANYVSGTGVLTLTNLGTATNAEFETALRSVTYNNASQDPDSTARVVEFVANDGALDSWTARSTISVAQVNDAPVVDNVEATSLSYTEGDGAVVVSTALTLADVDSATIQSATVVISSGYVDGQDLLQFTDTVNITASWVSGTGTLTLNGSASVAEYEAALRSVQYENTSEAPLTATRNIDFFAFDGSDWSAADARVVSLTAVNDAPLLDNSGLLQLTTITEDNLNNSGNTIAEILASDGALPVPISDVDGDPQGIAITSLVGNGTWQFDIGSGWTEVGSVSTTNALLLSATDSLRYVPDGADGELGTVLFHAWDQTSGSAGTTGNASVSGGTTAFSDQVEVAIIIVTAVNDAPTIDLDADDSSGTTGIDFDTSFVVGGGPIGLADGATLDDIDGVVTFLTIQITNIQDGAAEVLSWTPNGNIGSSYTPTTGLLTFINGGPATNAEFQALLNSLTYENTSATPDFTTRTINFIANDGADNSLTATATVAMTGDTTAPTAVNNTGSTVSEGLTDLIQTSELAYTDDLQPTNAINYTVTSAASNGFLALVSDQATPITSFTQLDIDSGNLVYVHNDSETLSDSFIFTVDDGQGNSLTGQSFSILVLAQNDAPVNDVPGVQVTNEDTSLVFNATNGNLISISDSDSTTSLIEVTVSTTNGTVTLGSTTGISIISGTGTDDTTVTFQAVQAWANIALNGLSFDPTGDFYGVASLTILTNDLGNSGGGGAMSDSDVINVTVNAINDAPTTSPVVLTAIAEDSGVRVISQAELLANANDVDFDPLQAIGLAITTGSGTLVDNGDGTWNYTPAADDETDVSFSYSVTDGAVSVGGTATLDITPVNDDPVLMLDSGSLVYTENAAPIIVSPTAIVVDADLTDFDGGTLTIDYGGPTNTNSDFLTVRNVGNGAGEIGVSGSDVTFGGTIIGTIGSGLNDGTGGNQLVVSLNANATQAAVEELAQNIAYENTSQNPTEDARDIQFTVNDGDGGTSTSVSRIVTPEQVNDGPLYSYFDNQSTDEDVALVISSGNGNQFIVYDFDIGANPMEVTLTVTNGTLTLVSTPGIAITGGADGSSTVTFTGILSAVNAAIDGLTYQPNTGYSGPDTLTVFANDQGDINDQGTGGARTHSTDISITVNPINDAPVWSNLSGPNSNYNENDVPQFVHPIIDLTDVDSANFDTGTLTAQILINSTTNDQLTIVPGGNVSISGTDVLVSGLTIGIVSGGTNGSDLVISFNANANAANVEEVSRRIAYANTSEDPTTAGRVIGLTVTDGDGGASASAQHTFTPVPVNDAPVVNNVEATSLAYTEGDGPLAISSTLSISDVDSSQLTSATIIISSGYVTGQDFLAFTDIGPIRGNWDAGTATLTLTGTDTLANYEAALRSVTYENTSDNPATGQRTVDIAGFDGTDWSSIADRDIDMTAVEDPAVIANIEALPLEYTENDSPVSISSTLTLTDVDSTTVDSAILLFGPSYVPGEDVLTFINTTNITGSWSAATGQLKLSGTDTVAAYEAALRSVTYENVSDTPDTTQRGISIVTIDGTTFSNTAAKFININAVNDAPTLDLDDNDDSGTTGNDFTTTFTEDSGPVLVADADALLNDVDSTIQTLYVTLTNPLSGLEALAATVPASILSSYDGGTGVLTLTNLGTATNAEFETALRSVTYDNLSQSTDTTPRVINFLANDGSLDSLIAQTTVNVVAVNDAPAIDLDADDSSGTTGLDFDTSFVAGGGPIGLVDGATLDDIDGDIVFLTVQITNIQDGAAEVLSWTPNGNIGSSYTPTTGLLTFTNGGSATNAEFQALLNSLTYENSSPTLDTTSRTITFVANDGADNSLTATATVGMTGDTTAPNVVNNIGSSVSEGMVDLIETSELAYSDDLQPAIAINYTVTSAASNGFLALVSAPTTPITSFTQDDIDTGNLVFVHDGSETTNDQFTFSVDDGLGNVVTGQTFDLTVAPINDAPTLDTNVGITVDEGSTGNVITNAMLNSSDTDDATSQRSYVVTLAPSNGTLFLNGSTQLNLGSQFTQADVDAGLITYAHDDSETVNDSFDFELIDGGEDGSAPVAGTFNITVNLVNDNSVSPILDIDAATNQVNENAANGTVVNIIAFASDADVNDNVAYSLDDDASGRFIIDGATGVVTVNDGTMLDRESFASHDIVVRATSLDGSTTTQSFTINLNDVNESPIGPVTDSDVAANQVDENSAVGTSVGVVAIATDPDATAGLATYSLSDNDGGRFAIDPVTGEVTVNGAIDREVDGATRSITVRATSGDGSFSEQNFDIDINDVNESPVATLVDSDAAANQIDEFTTNGTIVGVTAFASDADATDNTISYGLTNDAGGRFAIDPVTGVVTVANAGLLDFEANPTHDITVQASSSDGSMIDRVFTIVVNDNNDPPTLVNNNGSIVSEGGNDLITSTELLIQDDDNIASQLTYNITGGLANGQMEYASNTGVAIITFTQAEINSGQVRYIHDGSNTTGDQFTFDLTDGTDVILNNVFDITVNPINDPAVANTDMAAMDEDAVHAGASVLANDVDSDSPLGTAQLVSGPANSANFVLNNDGTFTYTPNTNYHGSDSFQYRIVELDGTTSNTATVNLTINPINDLPVGTSDTYQVVSGGTLSDLDGLLSNDVDVDQDSLVAVLLTQPANGTVTVTSSGAFTYVPDTGFVGLDSFTYVPNDGTTNGTVATVTIDVTIGSTGGGTDPVDPGDGTDPDDDGSGGNNPLDEIDNPNSGDKASVVLPTVSTTGDTADDRPGSASDFVSSDDELLGAIIVNQEAPNERAAIDVLDWMIAERLAKTDIRIDTDSLRSLQGITFAFQKSQLWENLDRLTDDVLANVTFEFDSTTTIAITTLTATAGYIIWSLRGGFLMATLLSSLPTWSHIDPLPIVESMSPANKGDKVPDDELDRLFD